MAGLSTAVRAYRYALMQELMRKHEYDALAFTGADWFEWAANRGLTDLSFERPFALIVTADGASFAVLSELSRHSIAATLQRGESWLGTCHYYAESPDSTSHRWTARQLQELTAEALRTAGLGRARIGVQSQTEWLTRSAALLPEVQLTSAGRALHSLRWVKHPDEIATMRECAALTDWAIDIYREQLRPGCLLQPVDQLVAGRLVAEAARRLPGQNFIIKGLATLSGAESACSGGAGAPNGRTLEANTIAMSSLGTRLNGLAIELGRPWLVGRPDQSILDLLDHSLAAQQTAIEAAVAGRPVAGIHAAAQAVLERAGLAAHLRLRAGHGIGVIQHDFPVDLPFDHRPLLEGELYAIEPGVYIAGLGGFRAADTVLVGASAAEPLTRASKDRAALRLG